MTQRPDPIYSLHPDTGVWKRDNYGGTSYTDGDAEEQALLRAVQSADDVSLFSPELGRACGDWVQSYHFSPARANILRPFEKALANAHVLEIGAGCGAITRYLGENAHRVTAVEGSLQRARIARARTRDIESVAIVADNFYAFESSEAFDVVTSIGVFEYANVYADAGKDGAFEFLSKAHRLLKDDGYLIIAIENKLGLKYFSGAPEDHLWKEMYGIEGRYQSNEPVTYGRIEIEAKLKSAGFRLVETHAALPDYKFPTTIITAHGAKLASQLSGELAAQASLKDRQGTSAPLFAQELAWKSIADNELLIDLANSHLIVAAKTSLPAAWDAGLLAEHYSTERKKRYAKITQFVAQDKRQHIDIRVRQLSEAGAVPPDPLIQFHPAPVSHYIEGELVATTLRRITTTDAWSIETFSSVFIEYLCQVSGLDRDQLRVNTPISGQYIDAVPGNIITGKDGRAQLFDQEWTLPGDIPLGWLAFRSLLIFLQSTSIHAKPADGTTYTRRTFMMDVFKRFDPQAREEQLAEYAAMEARLQSMVQDRPARAFLNWWGESPLNMDHASDRLLRANAAALQLSALEKKYEDSQRDVAILQSSQRTASSTVSATSDSMYRLRPAHPDRSEAMGSDTAATEPGAAAWFLLRHIRSRLTPKAVIRRKRDAYIQSSGMFDPVFYLREYPDVARAGVTPLEHYLTHGWKEGRHPSASFSTTLYLEHNSDVRQMGINPLVHYIQHGKQEGRTAHPLPPVRIDSRLSLAFCTPYQPEAPSSALGLAQWRPHPESEGGAHLLTTLFRSDRGPEGRNPPTSPLTEIEIADGALLGLLSELSSHLDSAASSGWMISLEGWQLEQGQPTDLRSIARDLHPQLHKLLGEGVDFVSLAMTSPLCGSNPLTDGCKATLDTVLANELRVTLPASAVDTTTLHTGFWISPALIAQLKEAASLLLASTAVRSIRSCEAAFFALQMICLALCKKEQARAIRLAHVDEVTTSPDYQGSLDFRGSIEHPSIKLLAYYLPQFHPTPENDEWHGKGFTEWFKTRSANKQFPDHYQQHTPSSDIGFYDLGDIGVLKKQSEMLAQAGMHGLIFYHYWFGGKLILERPAQLLLANPNIAINFCFCWANENWTRTWDGNEKEILLAQDYSVEDAIGFIRYLIPFFRDPRHVNINGRPVLFIYRPASIPAIQQYTDAWRDECLAAGLSAPYLVSTLTRGATDPRHYCFDAAVERPLHDWTDGGVPERRQQVDANAEFEGSVLDYSDVADFYCRQDSQKDYEYFRSLVPVWDNTARYQERGLVLHNFALPVFQTWLTTLIDDAERRLPEDRRFVVINAWNEWAEGAHLEPDLRYGYGYLNAVGRAMSRLPSDGLPAEFLMGQTTEVQVEMSEAFKEALSQSPDFASQFARCLRDSALPGFVQALAEPADAALLSTWGFPGVRARGAAETAPLCLRLEQPVIFESGFLTQLLQDAVTHPYARVHAYTVNDAGFSGTVVEGNHTINGRSAVTCGPTELSAASSNRLSVQARCYIAGIRTKDCPDQINTIIRFHATGDERALADALYCLAAQRDVIVHPLLMGQDLSDAQMERIQTLLDGLPWPAASRSRIVRLASSSDVPDLRSKLLAEGLKHVEQTYAAFLDFDDTLYNDAYVNLIDRVQATGKAFSFGRLNSASFDGEQRTAMKRTPMFLQRHRFEQFFEDNFVPLHSYVMDMGKIDVNSLIYYDHMKFMEDYFISLQLLTADNADWDGFNHPTFVGDYNFRMSGTPNTLALTTDAQKDMVLSDPHYQLCALRIQWIRQRITALRKGGTANRLAHQS